jgi:copper chaperone CopZ
VFFSLQPASAGSRELNVSIKGAVCATCAEDMVRKLEKMPAVEHAEYVPGKHRLSVTLRPGRTLSDDLVARIVRDAGYPVVRIDRAVAGSRGKTR